MIVLCSGCEAPIVDQFLLTVLDRNWHDTCLRCHDCQCQLTNRCFSRDERLYCKEDFFRRFGSKCFRCNRGIAPTDLVRRARDRVYHVTCFACIICRRQLMTGDEMFILDDDNFICKDDFYREGNTATEKSDEENGLDYSLNKDQQSPPPPPPPPHSDSSFDFKNATSVHEDFLNNQSNDHDNDDDDNDDDETLVRCNKDDRGSRNDNESQHSILIGRANGGSAVAVFTSSVSGQMSSRVQNKANRVTSLERGSPISATHDSRPETVFVFPEVASSPLLNAKYGNHLELESNGCDSNFNDDQSNPSINIERDNERDKENSPSKDETTTQSQGSTKRRGPRTTIKAKQLETLKSAFTATPKPTRHIREQLAQETGLNMRVIQVWFQNRRSKERRMKQLNALGPRRHFYRNPRRLRGARSGEVGFSEDTPNHLLAGTSSMTISAPTTGFTFFSEKSDFYSTYSNNFHEFFPLPLPAAAIDSAPFLTSGTLTDHLTSDPTTGSQLIASAEVCNGRHRVLMTTSMSRDIYLQQQQQLAPDSVRDEWLL